MADSVSAQKERDLAVPLTWLCHPTLDSGSARSGGRGGGSLEAPCSVVQRHVRLQARLPCVASFQTELEQC